MKLNLNTDFTKFPRAVSVLSAGNAGTTLSLGRAILAHDERHLRRRAIELADGSKVLVDLPEPVALNDGDRLVLEDGGHVEIVAAAEEVYDIRARDGVHLAELAWHIGNRHLAASIEAGRILILRDHVIKAMLEGLGATVADVSEPFKPVRGAYSGHGGPSHDHGHAHAHSHAEAHSHSHDEAHSHSHSHAGHHHDHD
ncbi:urease accessory protein UreE [Mesorhizobium sp. M7A.F.Ca.MR.362.00.0.0]|uniref:urease accessory protein UreE n=1 Tax=Mesorhizobium sp. M7A.F.Ca.MR.362.00.0.0 TaxID=2496779 RepID=UPI000FD2504F|nr:urease accessory protein UreE [Mesorhizobium sp. M7A.F.Ca.MR.362.00.0.0]RUU80651.1 urease accessory protein UreE [Mesorhizobium sp. M7A.F.Ca.MR.362.00.0.0]RWN97202.1 MAG: urease accessory protein UreE [Mesorhizobium sp.]